MRIEGIIWLRQIEDKLLFKHGVETHEVEEVLGNQPKFRYVDKGERDDETYTWRLAEQIAGVIWL
jgi:hypothetical protein